MSSSPQNARRTRRGRAMRPPRLASLPCPMCGRTAVVDVVEDYALSGGRIVKRLRHTRCRSCGERFFDVAAMAAIETAKRSSARRRSD